MRRTRYWVRRFNLIEIVLAMGVVGIGIAGVMSLMVPALNANKDAVNESLVVDAVSKLKGYLELVSQNTTSSSAWVTEMQRYGESIVLDSVTGAYKYESGTAQITADSITFSDEVKEIDDDPVSDNPVKLGSSVDLMLRDPDNNRKMYVYVDSSNNPQLFLWLYRSVAPKVKAEANAATDSDNNMIRYIVEISWPASGRIPYSSPSRQFRRFAFEITNPHM